MLVESHRRAHPPRVDPRTGDQGERRLSWNRRARDEYEQRVLATASHEGMPADLFDRYGIDVHSADHPNQDPAAFTTHTDQVYAYWRGLMGDRRGLRPVLSQMMAAHEELVAEGSLTLEHFQRVRADLRRRERAGWTDAVDELTTSVLDRAAFDQLSRGVELSEEQALEELRTRGVLVVDQLPDLPTLPPLRDHRALSDHLRTRGARCSAEVVFGRERLAEGFTVLDGFRLRDTREALEASETTLSDAALDAAALRIQREPMTKDKIAAEGVLALLRSAASPGRRDRIMLWEITSHLACEPARSSEHELVRPWVRSGLDEGEALRIAAALRRGEHGIDQNTAIERQVRSLLSRNCLRQAEAAVAELPPEHALGTEVAEAAAHVARLVERADRALEVGRDEDAARDLASAVELAADDERLSLRLDSITPAPPREVAARVDGRRVVVTWRPSTSVVGRVSYRVTRRSGREGGDREESLGEVSGTELVDDRLGVGSDAHYTVVAVRGGLGVSPAASSRPVMLTPEVCELRPVVRESVVSATWRPPPEAVRVEVLRGEGAPPHGTGPEVVPVEHDGSGFHDTSVLPDVEYFYLVRAVYLTSQGHARRSEGEVFRALPGPRAVPVRDLRVDSQEGGFVASWTPPERGRVLVFTGRRDPSVVPGSEVDTGSRAPVDGEPDLDADGRCRLPLVLPAGVTHVLAVTVAGESAVAGACVRVVAAPPVSDLRAERFDTVVRLSWTWPEHAATALVTWCPDTEEDTVHAPSRNSTPDTPQDAINGSARDQGPTRGSERRSRMRYDAEGGFEARMGSGPLVVTVRTLVSSDTEETLSAATTVRVPGRVVLDYRVEAAGLLRRERTVHLSANSDCAMPEIAIVFTPGEVQPHTCERGRVLSVLPARRLRAGERVSVRVRPPRDSGPGWLMCFPVDRGSEVRLRQPSVKELRL